MVRDNHTEVSIYRINITDGSLKKLYFIQNDVDVIILSHRYILLSGSTVMGLMRSIRM